jgi:hypothetical protein
MKRVLAIARLTFWEGIRMRIVLVFLLILVFIVLRLPFALRGDETLAGRLQTFLSYSLGALSVFMSLATVFLSCSTLTKDIQDRYIHMVITKPVTRFQILLGKWVGVNLLNLLMVLLSGLAIYGFAAFIKTRPEQFLRDRLKIDDTVWLARAAARPVEPDFVGEARRYVDQMIESGRTFDAPTDAVVQQYAQSRKESWKRIEPGGAEVYRFENLTPPESAETVYQVNFKAQSVPQGVNDNLRITWAILDTETNSPLAIRDTDEQSARRHQFLVRAGIVKNGQAALGVYNPPANGRNSIYFEGDDGLEIFYRVGSFETNFGKALLLILFRLAFLSAAGLFFGTFVSFPVACFCVLTIFMFCLGMPWWQEAIGMNLKNPNIQSDPYGAWGPYIRPLVVPVMKLLLPNFVEYDGIGNLIEGTLIPGGLVLRSAAHTLIYGALLLVLPGWLIFRSREIAQTIV